MAKKKTWRIRVGMTVKGFTPEQVFDRFTDAADFSAAEPASSRGPLSIGSQFTLLEGDATCRYLELDRPSRIVFTWRSTAFPSASADSRVEVLLKPQEEGTDLSLEHHDFQPPKSDYEFMMLWTQTLFPRLRRCLVSAGPLPVVPPEPPPSGGKKAALVNWLGASRQPAEWQSRFGALALACEDPASLWWRAEDPTRQGLQLWVRGIGVFGRASLVRAAKAAAETALPVWQAAELTKPEGFADLSSGLDPKKASGARPPAQIRAVEIWLERPDEIRLDDALKTTDQTRQLRFCDEEMGDLLALPAGAAAYALESNFACALSTTCEGPDEAELAALCAVEAIRGSQAAEVVPGAAKVAEAIREALLDWVKRG
ncbi:MAG: SRPBCC domain-containing protein [Thermoanaerobaculia bacterium]|nr:SRPBCC domain-containing protein [Thermoanaerobaculia bacterium]